MSIRDALAVMKDVLVWLISSRQREPRARICIHAHTPQRKKKIKNGIDFLKLIKWIIDVFLFASHDGMPLSTRVYVLPCSLLLLDA